MQTEPGTGTEGKPSKAKTRPWGPGLSSRLLFLTIAFVLIAEALVFLPSLTNYRTAWLNERIEMAQTAVLAVEAAPERRVSDELSRRLLENAQIVAVAAGSDQGRELILSPAMEISGQVAMVDLRDVSMTPRIRDTLSLLFDGDMAFLRILAAPKFEGDFIEVIVEAAPLRKGLIDYANRILWLSLFLSGVVGSLIYFALLFIVVRPIRRITRSIERFRDDPRDWTSRILPSRRVDEIGRAKNALSDMESAVKSAMRERDRLAQLGEAMAKINHDLRNSLTAAQLVSDGLTLSDDPRVKRAAPRLERAIERAITLAEDTLQYGRSEPPLPHLQSHPLRDAIEEAAYEALAAHADIMWINDVEDSMHAHVDIDHLHRIIVNLIRNAAQALSADLKRNGAGRVSVRASNGDGRTRLEIIDDGPGIPARVRTTLFTPFSVSGHVKGSGLGLAIARELAEGMSGRLVLLESNEAGTVFELTLPTNAATH